MSSEIIAAESGAGLGDLPIGSRVAFVTMLGSLCPVTRAHLQMFEEAKKLLLHSDLGRGPYAACLGRISLNSDEHITQKLEGKSEKMAQLMAQLPRRELVELATSDADMPWVKYKCHHQYVDEVKMELKDLEQRTCFLIG